MKSTYKILISQKLVLKKFEGTVSINDLRTIFLEVKKLSELYPSFHSLNDFRYSTLNFTKNEFLELIKSYDSSTFSVTSKVFIINDPSIFVIYNFFKDNYNYKNTHIFSSVNAACNSCNIHPELVSDFFD